MRPLTTALRRDTFRLRGGLAFAASCATFALAILAGGTALAETVPVDLAHSRATFSVSHLLVSKVTGSVALTEVTIERPSPGAIPTAVHATLDPRRIESGDGDRDADLQGPDWFDSAKYPTWTFAGSKIVAGEKGAFTVDGILTVHGIGQAVTLAVRPFDTPNGPGYRASTVADRHGFGMTRTRADALVGSSIQIDLEVRPAVRP